jgi:transcriptional regulator with XRE-family HTH domain
VKVEKLRDEMYNRRVTIETLCKMTGIDRSRLYRRLNNQGLKMTLEEAKKITEALELPHDVAIDIFLA